MTDFNIATPWDPLTQLMRTVAEVVASNQLAQRERALLEESLHRVAEALMDAVDLPEVDQARSMLKERFDSNDAAIDTVPFISEADDGVWIGAWIWVGREEAI